MNTTEESHKIGFDLLSNRKGKYETIPRQFCTISITVQTCSIDLHKTSITINFFFSQETDTVDSIPGGEWVTHSSPNECGTHSKSVTLNAGDSEGGEERHDLWLVTGGLVGNNPLARVEAFDGQGWKYTAVKNLPVPVYLHCLVNF